MKAKQVVWLSVLWLAQSQAMTLPAQPIIPYHCKSCDNLSHADLNSNWVTNDEPFIEEIIHKQTSRKYVVKATLKQLHQGVAIYTQAPGALIHITQASLTSMKPDFYIEDNQGNHLSLQQASSLFANQEGLKSTAFAGQFLALQLKPELGFGQFIIGTTSHTQSNDELFIIHVYDKDASTYLSVETDKARYHYGDELKVTISLQDADLSYPIDFIKASLISPDGNTTPLNLEQIKDNLYQAHLNLTSDNDGQGENWYVAVETSSVIGTQIIKRQAHTAFSYMIPSATIRQVERQHTKPFSFTAKIEVATGSRYALEAVLFGSDTEGRMHPIQTVQSASWLSIGKNNVNFSFDSDLKTDYKAPYYLGYLHLIDFGQLKPVYEYNRPIALTTLG